MDGIHRANTNNVLRSNASARVARSAATVYDEFREL